MALLVIVLLLRAPRALPLIAVVLLLLVAAYRTYIALASGYSRLALLHGFIGSSGRETELDAVVETTLQEAARIMRASRGVLLLLPVEGEGGGARIELLEDRVRRSSFDVADEIDAWWAPAMRGESVLLRSDFVQAPDERPRDGIAVPLQVSGTVDAVLLVVDRTFEAETFTTEDLRLFETLAAHVAVNLDKARLVDRLRRLADQRQHEARHDALTDLPNRLAFREALDEAIGRGEGGAVLLLDLDDFKDVNDTLGHDAGDTLLTVTGRRLDSARVGMVARLGGDEFAVLLPGADMEAAVACGRRLARLVAAPTSLSEVHLITSASIGVARFTGNESTSDKLLAQADVAMHAAKSGSRGIEVHSPADTVMVRRRLELAAALPAALRAGEIRAWFQPQSDATDGKIVGAEALLRWTHPLHGPIPPPEVIALAIRTGVLTQLTATMLDQALHRRAGWAAGGSPMEISVNVAPADLLEGSLPTTVARLLADTGTPANALTIEITESDVMTDPERCLAVLHELAMLGVKISVDDFGIGHSSLAYLDRLPVHEVKIDRSFVERIERRASDSTIMRATVALAHDLGLRVVAEGVENDVALERVIAVGCDRIQGFGLARPMSGHVFDAWIGGREREASRL
jgi:diguanylate cyclase (GGDEF)-like protein